MVHFPKINGFHLLWANSRGFHTFCPNGMYQHDQKVTFTLCDDIVQKKGKKKQKKPGRINDGDEGSWISNGTSFLKSCAPDCVLVKAICFWYNVSPTRHAPSHDARALSCGSFVPWLVARLPALGVHAPVE